MQSNQKKKAIKSLLKVININQGQLEERDFFKHLGISRLCFIKQCLRFKLLEVVHAEKCILKNEYDQSELIMSSEYNNSFFKSILKAHYLGVPHYLSEDTTKTITHYNEFLDIPYKL